MIQYKLYTWKDVERRMLLNKAQWSDIILDIETFTNDMVIYIKKNNKSVAQTILDHIFPGKYDRNNDEISLELPERNISVSFEVGEEELKGNTKVPLFRNVLYQESAYREGMLEKTLPGVPVVAFHSYKGGVGRTLSLLAFVRAWSYLKETSDSQRLLIVDADLEAPGLTWLTMKEEETVFSYLDLLEMTQGEDNIDDIVKEVADIIMEQTVKIETEKNIVEHIVLPTYRYIEQLLDMYSSPESLANSYKKNYILAEVLSRLGEKVNAALVLVDLRAGLSEFSAPLLFDPRVKKYLVTSTSYQSVRGMELLLRQMCKGLPLTEDTLIPEILLTMVQPHIDVADIESRFTAVFDEYKTDSNSTAIDNIVTTLPFASELVHLEGLDNIMKVLRERDFYKNILNIVENSYVKRDEKQERMSRTDAIKRIHRLANKQMTAEANEAFDVLMTEPIKNLLKKYRRNVPNTVIMGAKGSGKTFLYREIMQRQYWESFVSAMVQGDVEDKKRTMVIPLLDSSFGNEFNNAIKSIVDAFNACNIHGHINGAISAKTREKLQKAKRQSGLDELDWKNIWEKIILGAFDPQYESLDDLERDLSEYDLRLVFMLDGLEDIFQETTDNEVEKRAIKALCRDLIGDIGRKYSRFGCVIFLRNDIARDSIRENYEQFYSLYKDYELKWSSTEALRLALWLVKQAVDGFYEGESAVETASRNAIDQALIPLWGKKLGKPTSNEANSSRWILAALSDFNGQLQARDIIRFLKYATETEGTAYYDDRYLMPVEIKKAVSDCSADKMKEISQEIKSLKQIFDKLKESSEDKRKLPFYRDTFNLSAAEEKLMKQEGYLRIDKDKYYLPEIARHALDFKYEKGARPKVLSLTLK